MGTGNVFIDLKQLRIEAFNLKAHGVLGIASPLKGEPGIYERRTKDTEKITVDMARPFDHCIKLPKRK